MSARVRNQFTRIVVGTEAGTLRILSEGKLQKAHSWKPKSIAKRLYTWSNHTEILSNKWQFFQFSLQNPKKLCTWPFTHFPSAAVEALAGTSQYASKPRK